MNKARKTAKKEPKQLLNDYVKYTGIAAKMVGIMLAGVFAGMYLDEWITSIEVQIFTILCTISAVALAMYSIIKEVSK